MQTCEMHNKKTFIFINCKTLVKDSLICFVPVVLVVEMKIKYVSRFRKEGMHNRGGTLQPEAIKQLYLYLGKEGVF